MIIRLPKTAIKSRKQTVMISRFFAWKMVPDISRVPENSLKNTHRFPAEKMDADSSKMIPEGMDSSSTPCMMISNGRKVINPGNAVQPMENIRNPMASIGDAGYKPR